MNTKKVRGVSEEHVYLWFQQSLVFYTAVPAKIRVGFLNYTTYATQGLRCVSVA